MKSQIISMDFILSFLIYALAISIFFWFLQTNIPNDLSYLNSELLYERLDEASDFLDGARIDKQKLDSFIIENNYEMAYSLFKDFENPFFKRTDYCIFVENISKKIMVNFGAGREEGFSIIIGSSGGIPIKCGTNPSLIYSQTPICEAKNAESMVFSKPVSYNGELAYLKIMVCAQK